MPNDVTIRTATMDDFAAVSRLLRELDDYHVTSRPAVFHPFDDSAAQRERVADFVDSDDAELIVAEVDLEIVALATVRVTAYPDAPMFRPGPFARMDNLVVDRARRGGGIARELLESVTQWAAQRELTSLVINVWNANDAGVSFYTRQGFTPRCQQMELPIPKAT